MDSYTFALVLGGTGLVAMAATGLAHSGSHDGAGGHDAGGHAHLPHADGAGHPGHAAGAHAAGAHAAGAHAAGRTAAHHTGGLKSTLLSLASPRVLFSLLVGFGLTGVVARPLLGGI